MSVPSFDDAAHATVISASWLLCLHFRKFSRADLPLARIALLTSRTWSFAFFRSWRRCFAVFFTFASAARWRRSSARSRGSRSSASSSASSLEDDGDSLLSFSLGEMRLLSGASSSLSAASGHISSAPENTAAGSFWMVLKWNSDRERT